MTDAVPLYDRPEPCTHSRFLSAPKHNEKTGVKAIKRLIISLSAYYLFVKLYLLDIWARNRTPRRSECLYRCNTKECCLRQGS